jgi:hypothetical protein
MRGAEWSALESLSSRAIVAGAVSVWDAAVAAMDAQFTGSRRVRAAEALCPRLSAAAGEKVVASDAVEDVAMMEERARRAAEDALKVAPADPVRALCLCLSISLYLCISLRSPFF